MAKGFKTGGRKKGVPNKVTLKREAEIKASGLTPLDYMLQLLRNPKNPRDVRFEAAKAAAPYVHPKLAAIEHSGPGGGPIQTEDVSPRERIAGRIARLASRAGADGDPSKPE
ncbi:hypothetical protein GGR16_002396 [Chelatococcus caeni]|uniref:Uncharacterized protein n=1 Tax=Chelatococcus caeni TaxID=1348468 RepID=A0A840C4P1_9HYPH|nr:hypothetical protein [Chelatococcus caeni]MBB4017367.1 hypothetical protein [Chelatococcus caeni]